MAVEGYEKIKEVKVVRAVRSCYEGRARLSSGRLSAAIRGLRRMMQNQTGELWYLSYGWLRGLEVLESRVSRILAYLEVASW